MITLNIKSKIPDSVAASGTIKRGKYTLVTRLELLTKLPLASVMALWTNSQITSALRAKTGYGVLPVSKRAKLLNSSVKIAVVTTGCKTAHAMPMTVSLTKSQVV